MGGLRERKKQEQRQAIADAALELFVERGFDRVTVAEVAAAVGVSEKTVYNYFPTKEDLFFDEIDEREAALVAAFNGRRPGESIVDALRRSNVTDCGRMCSHGFAAFARVIEDSPALRAKELEIMARFTRRLAEAIREETGSSEFEAQAAASALIGVHWQLFVTARKRALEGRLGPAAAAKLRADMKRGYDLLERGLGALDVRTAGLPPRPSRSGSAVARGRTSPP